LKDDTKLRLGLSSIKRYLYNVFKNNITDPSYERRLEEEKEEEEELLMEPEPQSRKLGVLSSIVPKKKQKPNRPTDTDARPAPPAAAAASSSSSPRQSGAKSSTNNHASSSLSHKNVHPYHSKEFDHKYVYGAPYKCLVSENLSPRIPISGEDETTLNTQVGD
jgi:hypothetical protein